MIKYIDAELLKKGLKELESVIYSNELVGQSMHPYDCGQLHAIKVVKELINSLQQEQPSEDLKKEFNQWLRGVEKRYGGDLPYYGEYGLFCVARHFYELGKKSK